MFLKSIRFKITLWYLAILSLTLSIFSISVYNNFRFNLYEDMDDLLESKALGVASAINTYWATQKLEASQEQGGQSVFSKINTLNFAMISRQLVKEKSTDSKLNLSFVQIYDDKGSEIASSENTPAVLALPQDLLEYISEGEDSYDNFNLKRAGQKGLFLRLYTLPIIENGKLSYIVQVGSPLEPIYDVLDSLKVPMLIYLPLTVLLTGLAGLFLVNLAFRPVNSIIRTIRQITAENLKLRVNIPDTKDEIKSLADTFNDMLLKLDEAFSTERRFIQDASHELKTPLTILKGELEVTLKSLRSAEEYESVLISSLEEVNRISKIVDDLLTLARFDNQEIPLDMQRVDLGLLVQDALNDIDILAQQKEIRIDFADGGKISLDADERYLKRLFLNLLDNAIKYTPQDGQVKINLSKSNGYARAKISDTGVGIPEQQLPLIFERFYRVGRSRDTAGFGLGLAIAHSIVQMHKGKIEVESQLDKGTTFSVYLPLPLQYPSR